MLKQSGKSESSRNFSKYFTNGRTIGPAIGPAIGPGIGPANDTVTVRSHTISDSEKNRAIFAICRLQFLTF